MNGALPARVAGHLKRDGATEAPVIGIDTLSGLSVSLVANLASPTMTFSCSGDGRIWPTWAAGHLDRGRKRVRSWFIGGRV